MSNAFVLHADERGYDKILSTGATAAYAGGHPDAFITRCSSFNFGDYQDGRPGFGRIRVFGDEAFYHPGCSYNMHPHHNFIICAFVLEGKLTHINTLGQIDELGPGDYYAFSAGSGGLHEELNRHQEPMRAIYLWLLPDRLLLPPSYERGHFDATAGLNRISALVGDQAGTLTIPQDAGVSRLVSNTPGTFRYRPRSAGHGVYAFVIDGMVRCDGTTLKRRDSKAVWGADEIIYETHAGDTDVLLVETII
ncbi:pirin family protein [Rhodopila globiformis]|uniref:Pirin n=1 Tax=Rhodopila globiformis TaxID=1071 RepID=A0A2S6N373_RHOGL|nr:pirin family protein [Rhodopila globiformis]PPQ29059.1 pirin [Rhodopila globiformis]